MATKIDFKKSLAAYKAPRGRFEIVDVPDQQFLMIDGHGDPNTSPLFEASLKSLYPVAYKLKFHSSVNLDRDYVVPPLEGLWWAEDMDAFTTARDKSQWEWTMMIMTPDWIDRPMFDAAVALVDSGGRGGRGGSGAQGERGERGAGPERLGDVRFERLSEGRSVQTLHVGSFDDETAVLRQMHDEFIPEQGLQMTGRHHEIYLSDFRRVEPAKQRTILRQPVL